MGADTGAEYGGVLVGNAAPSTNFVLITASVAAASAVLPEPAESSTDLESTVADGPSSPGSFALSAVSLEALARQVAETYPGQRIVGWYHSHPRAGVFLSAHDLYIQTAFFAQAWQVGYVYDPVQAQRGFFGWSGRDIVRVPNWEVTTLTTASGADLPVNAPVSGEGAAADTTGNPPIEPFGAGVRSSSGGQMPPPIAAGPPASLAGPRTPLPSKKKRRIAALAVLAAIIAIVVAAIVINAGDDEKSATTTDSSTVETPAPTRQTEESSAVVTSATALPTSTVRATTTTGDGTTATTGVTEVTAITFPPTPTAVEPPASRVGPTAVECEQSAPDTYEPIADCFVPLNNGNIMVFVSGSLRCTEPAGQVLAAEAQEFTIGIPDDPLVLVADGALTSTCIDLGYAKNLLAEGADTLDGLCGSSGTQINDATRRCFGHDLASGAMVAIVRGTEDQADLVASCSTADAATARSPITWSNNDVGTAWLVDSVIFDRDESEFVATASRNGASATATISCG